MGGEEGIKMVSASTPSVKAKKIKLIVSQAFFLGKPMRDAAFFFFFFANHNHN